ncbi:Yip1 family protein [Planomicrobium sp. CPCC 101079]|uniref:Yip1 family protein n=1 Tax=Planomicrobium sp. CPCC 101079 TaxID=2599618 RepID=UPI0011B44B77|nr:Yip1 family protein [Planomicrobium sp. CPCC 101079]TWT09331.1 YIP1 family protein [Planomicrobium sp. CPCC 101079]
MNEMKEKSHYKQINPFTAIWVRTRETVRYVIEEKTTGYALMIIVIAAVINALLGTFDPQLNGALPLWASLLIGCIIGPIAGIAGVAILSALYLLIGKMFKGVSTYSEMFKAIGTTSIPSIWFAPIFLIGNLAAPDVMLGETGADTSPITFVIAGLVGIASLVLGIWSLIIQSKAIGEAHRFSSWKGFFTLLIPGVVLFVLFAALAIFFVMTFMSFS